MAENISSPEAIKHIYKKLGIMMFNAMARRHEGFRPELVITEIKDNGGYEHDFIGSVNGEVIGRAELLIDKIKREAEFRIHLIPEWQNQGYGVELTKVAVESGLKYLNRIWLGFDEGNERAKKIYEKVGFKYTTHKMEITKFINAEL